MTSGSLPKPITPPEGHNQVAAWGEGFNSTQSVNGALMAQLDDINIPSPRGPLRATHFG